MNNRLKIIIDNNNNDLLADLLARNDKSIDVNDLFANGDKLETPLTYAVATGNLSAFELLLNSSADLSKENSCGDTAISLAAKMFELLAFKKLVRHAKVQPHLAHVNSVTGNNIIHDIIFNYIDLKNKFSFNIMLIKERLELLTHATIDAGLQNNNDEYPITIIFNRLSQSNARDVKLNTTIELINLFTRFPNFSLNVKDPVTDSTPLMIAIEHDSSIAEYLCTLPDINANLSSSGDFPLHSAILQNKLRVAELLMNRNDCELNQTNLQAHTPIMVAAKGAAPFRELVSLLQAMKRRKIDLNTIVTEHNFISFLRTDIPFKALHLIITAATLSIDTLFKILCNIAEEAELIASTNTKRHAELVSMLREICKHKTFDLKQHGRDLLMSAFEEKLEYVANILITAADFDLTVEENQMTLANTATLYGMHSTAVLLLEKTCLIPRVETNVNAPDTRSDMLGIQAIFQLNQHNNIAPPSQSFSVSANSAFNQPGKIIPSRRPLYSASCSALFNKPNVPTAISIILKGTAQQQSIQDDTSTESTATESTMFDDQGYVAAEAHDDDIRLDIPNGKRLCSPR